MMRGRWKFFCALAVLLGVMTSPGGARADVARGGAQGIAGADVPWRTLLAIDAETNAERLARTTAYGELACEATTRACVRLNRAGEYVRWKLSPAATLPASGAANAIVVRHGIPDAPKGGGARRSLELFVNGKPRQTLTLDSRHAWLYGADANPQGDSPAAGPAHVFFDDARAFISGEPLRSGDVLELRHPDGTAADDSAGWIAIDLVDLEHVAPPRASPPDGFVAVTDSEFGARPDDDIDDTAAIQAALDAAHARGLGVWLPAGVFVQTARLVVPSGVTLRGAGPWHTRLRTLAPPASEKDWGGNAGLRFERATNVEICDLMIEGCITRRSGAKQHGITGIVSDFLIQNVWVGHTDTGGWLTAERGVIRHCRFRNTYADGFNVNNGSRDILFEHNHTRNTGDDGLASYAGTDHSGATRGPNRNITFRRNTVETPWWGHGIAAYGGDDIRIGQNLVLGAIRAPGIIVSTAHKSWPGNRIVVSENQIRDSGGTSWGQTWGALFVSAPGEALREVQVSDNTILRPAHDAVKIQGPGILQLALERNRIEAPAAPSGGKGGGAALLVLPAARGELRLRGNTLLPAGSIDNRAPAAQFHVGCD